MTAVKRLSLGTAQFGAPYGIASDGNSLSSSMVEQILDTAADIGIAALDTAPAYGSVERRIGEFMQRRQLSGAFEICTKLPALDAEADHSHLATLISDAVEASLRALMIDQIDRYLIHRVADLKHYGRALVDLLCQQRNQGRIRRIGVSVYTPADTSLMRDFPELDVIQHPVNLLDHRFLQRVTPAAEVHARSVFLQGLFALTPDRLPPSVSHANQSLRALAGLLDEWNLTPVDAALPFVMATGVDRVVIGVDSPEQLRSNMTAAQVQLPDGLFEALISRFTHVPEEVIDPRRWPPAA